MPILKLFCHFPSINFEEKVYNYRGSRDKPSNTLNDMMIKYSY